jgi:hypothetical protein
MALRITYRAASTWVSGLSPMVAHLITLALLFQSNNTLAYVFLLSLMADAVQTSPKVVYIKHHLTAQDDDIIKKAARLCELITIFS